MNSMKDNFKNKAGRLNSHLLELLICPVSKGPLRYDPIKNELISEKAGLAYPVREGIPIMLPEEARKVESYSGYLEE